MALSDRQYVDPKLLILELLNSPKAPFNVGSEQDLHEFTTFFLQRMEEALRVHHNGEALSTENSAEMLAPGVKRKYFKMNSKIPINEMWPTKLVCIEHEPTKTSIKGLER